MMNAAGKRLSTWLWLLLALFCFRVVAQLLQWQFSLSFLPAFDTWHSGALPYGVLVVSQMLIIAVMVRVCYRFSRGHVVARRRVGLTLLVIGALYFLTMLGRLGVGLFVLPDDPWFGQHLPALFHLVLASFVFLVGGFHYTQDRAKPR